MGPVYHIPCDSCDASYRPIGETERSHVFWSTEDPAPPTRKCPDIYRQSRTSSGHGCS